MNILVLHTGRYPSKYLVDAIKQRGHTFEGFDPKHLYGFIHEGKQSDSVYDGHPIYPTPLKVSADRFDALVPQIGRGLNHSLALLRQFTLIMGIYTPSHPNGLSIASDKYWTCQVLSHAGIKVPTTSFSRTINHVPFVIEKTGGLPVIAKTLTGSQGVGVMIFDTARSASTSLETLQKFGKAVKLQQYIEASGKDIRAIVVGDKVVNVMERTSGSKDEFRANLSKGGKGKKAVLTEAETKMCINATKALGLQYSGVDLMRDKDGNSYCTEINTNPGVGIIKITGYNHFIDLVKLIESQVKVTSTTGSKKDINPVGKTAANQSFENFGSGSMSVASLPTLSSTSNKQEVHPTQKPNQSYLEESESTPYSQSLALKMLGISTKTKMT